MTALALPGVGGTIQTLDKPQAKALLDTIGRDLETYARSGLRAAAGIATFVNGHGAEAIDGGWSGCPYAFLGGQIGLEGDSIRKLYRQGCALGFLTGQHRDSDGHNCPIGQLPSHPSQLTAMYRVILENRADEIPKVWAIADKIRADETRTWEDKPKKVPRRIYARHVSAAVSKILGPPKRKPASRRTRQEAPDNGQAAPVPRQDPVEQQVLQKDAQGVLVNMLGLVGGAMTAGRDCGGIPANVMAAVVAAYQLIQDATQVATA